MSTILGAPINFGKCFAFKVSKLDSNETPSILYSDCKVNARIFSRDAFLLGFEGYKKTQILFKMLINENIKDCGDFDWLFLKQWKVLQGDGNISVRYGQRTLFENASIYADHATTDKEGNLIYQFSFDPPLNITGREFIIFWSKANSTGDLYVSLRTDNQNYLRWWGVENEIFKIDGSDWKRWVIPLFSPTGKLGTFNSTEVRYFLVGIRGLKPNQVVDFQISSPFLM
jgi:hypothetical protein